VVVRCRPLNSKETADNRKTIVDMDMSTGAVTLNNPKGDASEPPKSFTFDTCFDYTVGQRVVYEKCARPVVNQVMDGYNGTIFAYGQTGTGKTHTMDGGSGPEMQGIVPNSFDHIFETVNSSSDTKQWMVRASFLEIYNEEVRDLLSKDSKASLELKEHKESGVYVKGLNAFVVKSVPELKNVLEVRPACIRHTGTCMLLRTHAHTCVDTHAHTHTPAYTWHVVVPVHTCMDTRALTAGAGWEEEQVCGCDSYER
jgi:kinesin family protein 3/17